MHRILGAGLIVIGAAVYGAGLARSLQRRVVELADLDMALNLLETEIRYSRTPLPEACGAVAGALDDPVKRLLCMASQRFGDHDRASIEKTWREVVRAWAPRTHLLPRELKALEALGSVLGRSDVADQVGHLRLVRERLRPIRQKLEAELEKQCRLRLYLGVAGGALLAVLLV